MHKGYIITQCTDAQMGFITTKNVLTCKWNTRISPLCWHENKTYQHLNCVRTYQYSKFGDIKNTPKQQQQQTNKQTNKQKQKTTTTNKQKTKQKTYRRLEILDEWLSITSLPMVGVCIRNVTWTVSWPAPSGHVTVTYHHPQFVNM